MPRLPCIGYRGGCLCVVRVTFQMPTQSAGSVLEYPAFDPVTGLAFAAYSITSMFTIALAALVCFGFQLCQLQQFPGSELAQTISLYGLSNL